MRPGQLPRLSGNFPGDEPDSCSCKRDTEMKLGLWEKWGKRGSGWLCREEKGRFSRPLVAPDLCTRYLLGCVWLLYEKPVAAG